MSENFVGEIALCAFDFAPRGWALCNGQLLPIAQNQALFAVLSTQFGGDGSKTFGLPNLQATAAISQGTGYAVGQKGGEASHTLSQGEMPAHTHTLQADASTAGTSNGTMPSSTVVLGQSSGTNPTTPSFTVNIYNPTGSTSTLDPSAVGLMGGQPHSNMMPSLGLTYCIALMGYFPTRS